MIWWASVVLPQPGAPAMMLKENSGRPPPMMSSRPRTPVLSWLIFTFSGGRSIVADRAAAVFLVFIRVSWSKVEVVQFGPDIPQQAQRERGTDECYEQPEQFGDERDLGRRDRRFAPFVLEVVPLQSLHGALRVDVQPAQPRHLGGAERQRPRK